MWLREDFGSRAFFPDPMNSKFELPDDISVSLVVEGSDPAVPGTSSGSVHVTTPPIAPRPSTLSLSNSKKMQTLYKCEGYSSYNEKTFKW